MIGGVGRIDITRAAKTGRVSEGRLSSRVTAKASSAEAILVYCLKRRGWTAKWRAGELTGRQHLQLLEDVRQYGRRWLRHEAESLFRHYGSEARGAESRSSRERNFGLDGNFNGATSLNGHNSEFSRSLTSTLASAIGRFFRRARSFVHELILAGGMILKGNEPLTATEVEELDRSAKVQEDFFGRFEQEVLANPPREFPQDTFATVTQVVEAPPMTAGQFVARAESYGSSVWQGSINAGRNAVAKQGVFMAERRVHALPLYEHNYCRTCVNQSDLGWQPLGTLREIGDSECMGNCDCYFEWMTPNRKIYNSPFGRHNPSGEIGPPGEEQEGKWIGTQGDGVATPVKKSPRKIVLKTTPNTNYHKIQRPPTKEEIDAEVKKYLEGKPNNLTITKPGEPPVVPGTLNPREGGGWKDESGRPTSNPLQGLKESTATAPEGYTTI